jgi:chemotaxis protein CheD
MGEGVLAGGSQIVFSVGIGSCVVVTLYHPDRRIGGFAHVMLPDSREVHGSYPAYQCADTAVAALLKGLCNEGVDTSGLVAKMVGGAKMFSSYGNGKLGMGAQNIQSIKQILEQEKIPLVGFDVAGHHGRSVEFHLTSGQMVVRTLEKLDKHF